MTEPRGLRNNNPGNIRHGKDTWQGMSPDQPDESFVKFSKPVYGIRAIARILLNYERKGFDTVSKVIRRWAPPSENNSDAYVKAVADAVGVSEDEVIDLDLTEIMLPMVKAIILHENGKQPYPDKLILEGMRLAGIRDVPEVSLTKKVSGDVIGASAVGLGVISQVAEPAKKAADSLGDFIGAPIVSNIVTGLLTIAGIATLARLAKTWLDHKRGI